MGGIFGILLRGIMGSGLGEPPGAACRAPPLDIE